VEQLKCGSRMLINWCGRLGVYIMESVPPMNTSPLPDRGKIYATRKTLRRCNPLTWIHMVVMWPARCCVWITSQYNSSGMWVEAFDSEKKLSPYRSSRSNCVNQNNWLQGDNNDIKASPTSMLKYKYKYNTVRLQQPIEFSIIRKWSGHVTTQ